MAPLRCPTTGRQCRSLSTTPVRLDSWYTINIAGGEDTDYYYDDILEYDPEEDTITSVGHMIQARSYHAISVVLAADYLQWCDGSM